MKKYIGAALLLLVFLTNVNAQNLTANVYGRNAESLNGKWSAIVDPYNQGRRLEVFKNKKAAHDWEFYEYSFDNAMRLNVPGDWNHQYAELYYYENTVWYARWFDNANEAEDNRTFIYFAGVNYRSTVYLNGEEIGEHEGGFTPFQFEVTGKLLSKNNFLVVEVNNTRTVDAIPAMSFDWWNYGGITRDVFLMHTPDIFIEDYFVALDKLDKNVINVSVNLNQNKSNVLVTFSIPELGISQTAATNASGEVKLKIENNKIERWSPENPKLYNVSLSMDGDRVSEEIGFRNLYVKGTNIYLNDKPIFLKGINFHEEIPQRKSRAFSEADAIMLLSEAKHLGCNMIRLAHYSQNEYIVRLAEKMGFLLWEEIPVWQGIDFANPATREKASTMIGEMLTRDKNRCAVAFWSVANETKPSGARNEFLSHLIDVCRRIDTTRLITAAFDLPQFNAVNNTFEMDDDFARKLDVIAVNKYIGWYLPWPARPEDIKWNVTPDKPLIFSEFGGESLYGQRGDSNVASSWSEEYQEKLYRDNLKMFENIPNLRGTAPWILFDFRSPFRFHPTNQEGWNRKGLISDQGYRKKAWYVMKEYYNKSNKALLNR